MTGGVPRKMDPMDTGNIGNMWPFRIYESMAVRNTDGSLAPDLALSWKQDADGMGSTYKLRQGVEFQTGGEVTSADVIHSFNASRGSKEGQGTSSYYIGRFAKISDYQAVDRYTVHFDFSNLFVELPQFWDTWFASVISKDWWDAQSAAGKDPYAEIDDANPSPGSGPYTVTAWEPGTSWSATVWDGHWAFDQAPERIPHFKNVEWSIIPETTTRASMLKTGQIDATEQLRPLEFIDVSKDANISLTSMEALDNALWTAVSCNPKSPGLKDVRVRKALSHALDRDEMVEEIWLGSDYAAPGRGMSRPMFGAGVTDLPVPKYDPAMSKSLLAEAGHPSGTITIYSTNSIWATVAETAEAMRQYWQAVGYDLEWQVQASAQNSKLRSEKGKNANYDGEFIVSRNTGYDGAAESNRWVFSTSGLSMNCNETWDVELEALSNPPTSDPAERNASIQKAMWYTYNNYAPISLFYPKYAIAYRSDRISEFPLVAGFSVWIRNLWNIAPK